MLFNLNPPNAPRRRRQPRQRRYRNGQRAAVARAIAGAKLLLGLPVRVTSQDEAAATVGVAVRYVTAAAAVLKAENPELLDAVLTGRVPLPVAGKEARKRGDLIEAYRKAAPTDRIVLARAIGPTKLWDEAVAPTL